MENEIRLAHFRPAADSSLSSLSSHSRFETSINEDNEYECSPIVDQEQINLEHQEKVAQLLVDHFIGFKGCKKHKRTHKDEYGMTEFVEERRNLNLPNPDFAQDERLPSEARVRKESEGLDNGRKMMKNPLSHSSLTEWHRVSGSFKGSLTGMDENGNIRQFHMEAGDLTKHPERKIREMAHGKVTVDIDSALTIIPPQKD